MEPKTLVLQYLDEAHATETALVTNLKAHIAMASDGTYRKLLERHLEETVEQVENIDRRRAELGAGDGRGVVAAGAGLVRDAIGQALVLTKGPIDAVRAGTSQAERMLKNAKDECATEALEIATYDHLEAAAEMVGDKETAKLARAHRSTEEKTLNALRKEIPKLAKQAIEERTGEKITAAATKGLSAKAPARASSSRSTSSRSTSGRSKSGSSSAGRSKSGSSSRAKSGSSSRAKSGSSSRAKSGSSGRSS
jgi:ferritin-like metal-binding protein YciE